MVILICTHLCCPGFLIRDCNCSSLFGKLTGIKYQSSSEKKPCQGDDTKEKETLRPTQQSSTCCHAPTTYPPFTYHVPTNVAVGRETLKSQADAGWAEQTQESWRIAEPFQNYTSPDFPHINPSRKQYHDNWNPSVPRLTSGALGGGWKCHMMDNLQRTACHSWLPLFQVMRKTE